jgi:DNA repair ATPase RecN
MGYITLLAVSNDGCENIRKHPQEFVDKFLIECSNHEPNYFGVGNHVNMCQTIGTRHDSYFELYAVDRGSFFKINEHCDKIKEMAQKYPEDLKNYIRRLKETAKELEKLVKQNEQSISTKD